MQFFDFMVFKNVASGQLLSVRASDQRLHQSPPSASGNFIPAQQWLPTQRLPGPSQLLNRATSFAIDITGNPGSLADHDALQQYPPNAGPNQLWLVENWQGDPYQLIIASAENPRYVIDIPNGDAHADPQLYHRHEGPNQRWTYTMVDLYASKIQSAATGGVLDVPGGSQQPGVAIQQFRDAGHFCFNQFWQFFDQQGHSLAELNSGNWVRIVSLCNDLALQPDGPPGHQSWVRQQVAGDPRQFWGLLVEQVGITVQPDPSVALDLQNSDPHDGVLIQVFPAHLHAINQLWKMG